MQQCHKANNENSLKTFLYDYIDVERLIIDNLNKRIKRLTSDTRSALKSAKGIRSSSVETPPSSREVADGSPSLSRLDHFGSADAISSQQNGSPEDLKAKLLLYANVVTNSWVLGLITKEIEKQPLEEQQKKIYLINLIPNRVNVFRNCLYLKQAPNFVSFHFNYIALNLIKSNAKRKDLDQLASNSCYDDIYNNFINYFRLINKLVEIKVDHIRPKLKIKVSKNKNAIKIQTNEDMLSFLFTPKKDGIEIDLSEFNVQVSPENSLTFIIKNEIDLNDSEVLVFDGNDKTTYSIIRKFVKLYHKAMLSI